MYTTDLTMVMLTYGGASQGILNNALHLWLDVILPQALLGTTAVQVVCKLGAGPHVPLSPVPCTNSPTLLPMPSPAPNPTLLCLA